MSISSEPDPIRDQYAAIATGDLDATRRAVSLDWQNREATDEAPAARQGGPVGLAVTAAWLRSAFSDIAFEEIERLTDGDVVISRVMFSARQTGPLVLFADGRASAVFPPSGRTFRIEQIHRHELRGGEVIHHLARRDDLGMMRQLGHLPPTPRSIVRMIVWRLSGRSRRAAAEAAAVGERAAAVMSDRLAQEASTGSIERGE
jgi:predicted ester cyclase